MDVDVAKELCLAEQQQSWAVTVHPAELPASVGSRVEMVGANPCGTRQGGKGSYSLGRADEGGGWTEGRQGISGTWMWGATREREKPVGPAETRACPVRASTLILDRLFGVCHGPLHEAHGLVHVGFSIRSIMAPPSPDARGGGSRDRRGEGGDSERAHTMDLSSEGGGGSPFRA